MPKFLVTFAVTTHESAEHGEHERTGYYDAGGWENDSPEGTEWTLSEIVEHFRGYLIESPYIYDEQMNSDGEYWSYCIHPTDAVTAASWRRVCDYLSHI